MPMDDATASDNCGEVTIEVRARRPQAMLQATTPSFARSRRRRCWKQQLATQTITVQDTTAPEFTFVPADYTVEVLRRDADGRRHGVGQLRRGDDRRTSETTAGDAAGNYTIVRTFTATDDAGNSSATQTITVQDTTAPEFTFVPADYTVDAQEMHGRRHGVDNCEVTIVQRDHGWRCCGQLHHRPHLHGDRRCWQQQSAPRPSRSRTPPRLNSPSSLPTTRSMLQTRCRWTTPRRRTTAAR